MYLAESASKMLWKTHIRIAHEVLFRLGLSKSTNEAQRLRDGSIAPDKWKDYPHHEGKSNAIKNRLLRSRAFYLENNLNDSYFELGVALHYIQDGFTTLTSRSRHHERWEKQIEQSYFTNDLESLVERAFKNDRQRRIEYNNYIIALSQIPTGKIETLKIASISGPGLSYSQSRMYGKPYVDLNFALRASYIIAKSVLGHKVNDKLQQTLYENKAQYKKILNETEKQAAYELIKLANKLDMLKNRRCSGFFSQVSNKINLWITNVKTNNKFDNYAKKKHLHEIMKEYHRKNNQITAVHNGWYLFSVPTINLKHVRKKLITKNEVLKEFNIEKSKLDILLNNNKISSVIVKNEELLKYPEINNALKIIDH